MCLGGFLVLDKLEWTVLHRGISLLDLDFNYVTPTCVCIRETIPDRKRRRRLQEGCETPMLPLIGW
jgi:hypothetical protein